MNRMHEKLVFVSAQKNGIGVFKGKLRHSPYGKRRDYEFVTWNPILVSELVDECTEDIRIRDERIVELETSVADLNLELDTANDNVYKLSNEIELLRNQLLEKDREISSLKSTAADISSLSESKPKDGNEFSEIEMLNMEMDMLNLNNRTLQDEVRKADERANRAEASLGAVQEHLQAKIEEIANLRDQLETFKELQENGEAVMDTLRQEIQALIQEKEGLNVTPSAGGLSLTSKVGGDATHPNYRAAREDIRNQSYKASSPVFYTPSSPPRDTPYVPTESRVEAQAKDRALKQLSRKIEILQMQLDQRQPEAIEGEKRRLKDQIQRLETECEQLSATVRTLRTNLSEEGFRKAELERQNDALRSSLSEAAGQQSERCRKLTAERDTLMAMVAELQEGFAEAQGVAFKEARVHQKLVNKLKKRAQKFRSACVAELGRDILVSSDESSEDEEQEELHRTAMHGDTALMQHASHRAKSGTSLRPHVGSTPEIPLQQASSAASSSTDDAAPVNPLVRASSSKAAPAASTNIFAARSAPLMPSPPSKKLEETGNASSQLGRSLPSGLRPRRRPSDSSSAVSSRPAGESSRRAWGEGASKARAFVMDDDTFM